jgi:tRNA A37 methylthiotransferase MiaB
MKGKVYPCLIEELFPESPGIWKGRIYSQAPEVDGHVAVNNYRRSMGQLVRVRITGYKDVDLTGECIST